MLIHPPFPEPFLHDPMRAAELRVYQELARSDVPGQALYQVNAYPNAPELDFLAALERVAYVGGQIKGGPHERNNRGEWFLHNGLEWQKIPSPLEQAWLAAISVRDALKKRLDLNVYVVPTLVLTDMGADPAIDQSTANGKVSVLRGTDNLVERMIEVSKSRTINCPPNAGQIARVMEFFMPGLGTAPEPAPAPAAMEIAGRQLIIQRVDTMNVYTTGGEPEGR